MAGQRGSTGQPSRPPLGDATARVINTSSARPSKVHHIQAPQPSPLGAHPVNRYIQQPASPTTGFTSKVDPRRSLRTPAPPAPPAVLITPAIEPLEQDDAEGAKRESQDSTPKRRKTHVGPWELGKTLGLGSAAHVRLVRHKFTQQLAAVKILSRDVRHNTQPGSIAELDIWDRSRKEYETENRIPFTIEREVAILKLINHPNIVKLYDIWENHQEIYIVLEFVECGDFYGYLDDHGRLPEPEAMFFLRQLASALQYMHSFNICHRDLKPENILITKEKQLKITDFGMSALHQSPHHLLKTSCGSPHYAAPELVRPGPYRGDKADIWSLGVIFYASVIHALPFNDDNVSKLLVIVEKAHYEIPNWVSRDMRGFICCLLEKDPEKRLSASGIFEHPLVSKYDYLDDYNKGERALILRNNARYDPVPASEVDAQTLRQLKSVWHTYSEQQLASLLTNSERNEFKMFYWLLYSYREERLENYGTDITYSPSDYHHLQPPNWRKKYTTVEFAGKSGRSPSRFTVISNVATDEDGVTLERANTDGGNTVKSYDPYRSSLNMDDIIAGEAKVTIHRNNTSSTRGSKNTNMRAGSIKTNSSTHSRRSKGSRSAKAPSARRNSRHSLKSIMSGEEISYQRAAPLPKRGVEFPHAQRRLIDQGQASNRPVSIVGDDSIQNRHVSCPESPSKRAKLSGNSGRCRPGTQSLADVSQVNVHDIDWMKDLHDFSCSIAKDCDDAFNSSYLTNTPVASPNSENAKNILVGTPSPTTTLTIRGAGNVNISLEPLDMRQPPPVSSSRNVVTHDYVTARGRADRMYGQIPGSPVQSSPCNRYGSSAKADAERRIVTDPIRSASDMSFLPSINEASGEDGYYRGEDKPRVVSAPEPSMPHNMPIDEGEGLEYLASHGNTIRVVYSPSHQASKPRAPLVPGAKPKAPIVPESMIHQQPEMKTSIPREPSEKSSITTMKKKTSWFKRGSKDRASIFENFEQSNPELNRTDSSSSTGKDSLQTKKKSFGFAWWRGSKEQRQLKLSLADPDYDDSTPYERARTFSNLSQPSHGKKWDDKTAARNIEPQQSWLARLFRVKPATRYICFSLSKLRTRQELSILLKKWRRHGMRGVVVDRERYLVFARVGKKNHLGLKEASFAAEIMTVIEHGNHNPLCIVRFTQERGAATTFNKVVDTMEDVFDARDMLVTDKYKAKMMIKTLNS
ncbi:Pkinase-domain-containing protein [Annulohypoxylon maeteangense]|uniref:Pkinase-domain-containing protein n=1 Tax=Annulohypoxylon maeteangense TaxID=1927788 RepID=UPI002008B977|nr:Pkinase-domain-containing protein [Annulohypoxylon maeteangense]KAI0886009.1 Pkinase-domain-containing protein [Annulohypoxylon maeteangense]